MNLEYQEFVERRLSQGCRPLDYGEWLQKKNEVRK